MGMRLCKQESNDRVHFLGLYAAGKTSLLYRLKLGKAVNTLPTIGLHEETLSVNGLTITCWDLGNRCSARPVYRRYKKAVAGIVYVIDSNDREWMDEALDGLVMLVLLEENIKDTVVMVMANKQDLDNAMTAQEVEDCLRAKTSKLDLKNLIFVMPCSVMTGEGVWEAFDVFHSQIQLRKRNQTKPGFASLSELDVKIVGDQSVDTKVSKISPASLIKDPMHFLKSVLFY